MPAFSDSSCISDTNQLSKWRKEEKEKFDASHQCELKPLVIGSTVSFLNSDLKTWTWGAVVGGLLLETGDDLEPLQIQP